MMNDEAGRHPRDLLSPYLDGELGPDERVEVATHLEQCAACVALLDDLRSLAAGVAAEEPPPAPADLAARIGRRVDALAGELKVIPIGRPPWRSPLVFRSVAAVLAGIMATVVWYSTRPPTLRQETSIVMEKAASPTPEADRMALSRVNGRTSGSTGFADAAQDADNEALSSIGKQKKVAADAPAKREPVDQPTAAPPPVEPPRAFGKEQVEAEPRRAEEIEAEVAVEKATGDPGDRLASRALEVSRDSRTAADVTEAAPAARLVGSGGEPDVGNQAEGGRDVPSETKSLSAKVDLAAHGFVAGDLRERAAPGAPPVAWPLPTRSLELQRSDYRAVLSEAGALNFRSGAYECVVSVIPPSSPVDLSTEIRQIFELATVEQSRRAAVTEEERESVGVRRDASAGEEPQLEEMALQLSGSAPPTILTLRDANETPLYRAIVLSGRGAGAAASAAPIATRFDRLIREHYLPLMEHGCGPLPPELQTGDQPAPE